MRVQFDYRPLPVHAPFHRSTARERAIIGGYGSGKSYGGCAEAIALGLEQPGSEILVTRKTVPALRDTTEAIFIALLPAEFWNQCKAMALTTRAGGHWNTIQFPNGTLYYFRGMDDWKKLRSLNLAFIFYDEADEFTPEDYEGMSSRLRQTQPHPTAKEQGHGLITRRGTILACNPMGQNWVWARFVSPDAKDGTAYWTSSSLDNPYLPLDFINSMLDMPDAWVRRFVLCSFDEMGGAIYPSWDWSTHVVPRLTAPPDPDDYFVMGFDPGTAAKNAAVWAFYDKTQHRLIGVAEYAESGLSVDVHAASWRRTEAKYRMRVAWRVADPVINTRDRGTNEELSDQYRRAGFRFQLGPRKIEPRLTALGRLIHQRRFVVTEDCPRLYAQLKQYRWENLTPQQMEKGNTAKPLKTTQWEGEREGVDLVDAAQYLASRHISPPRLSATVEGGRDAETWASIRKQLAHGNATVDHDIGTIAV